VDKGILSHSSNTKKSRVLYLDKNCYPLDLIFKETNLRLKTLFNNKLCTKSNAEIVTSNLANKSVKRSTHNVTDRPGARCRAWKRSCKTVKLCI